jgi:hypothetical protein
MVTQRSAGVLFAAAVLWGCGATPARRGDGRLPPPSSRMATATVSAPPTRPPTPVLGPAFARAAATMDPVDLCALAATEGADRLASLLDDPRAHDTALAALACADDAELTYGRLAARARAHPGDEAMRSLDAFAESLERPSKRGELLDPEGVHSAIGDLAAIADASERHAPERALALTILRRLGARGFAIPCPLPKLEAAD